MKRLAFALLLAVAPLEAQAPDTVVVYVLGRIKAANVSCPAYGFVGDTLSCRIWATDSTGQRTAATFTVTSSAPGIVEPLGIVSDTILRLRLVGRGSSSIIVTAAPPSAVIIGGALRYPGATYTEGAAIAWPAGTDSLRLCGYVLAGRDTIGRSWGDCPGNAPVMAFRWEWTEHQPAQIRQASRTVQWFAVRCTPAVC